MGAMMRKKDNGIYKCFMGSNRVRAPPDDPHCGVKLVFGGRAHPQKQAVSDALYAYRGDDDTGAGAIRFMLPFQVEAVLNMVFRPAKSLVSKTIVRCYGDNPRVTQSGANLLRSFDDDIGMLAINDLFTGSGKTLTTFLGAILFADKRSAETVGRLPFLMREQTHGNWGTRVQCSLSREHQRHTSHSPRYDNVVIVMCAKHLMSQWKSACFSALRILGMESEIDVDVLENPLPGSAALQQNKKLKIVLLHSAANLARLALEFVPVIVVDEFTIKSISNILTKPSEMMPLHGRLILVSADAGSIINIIHGAHKRSFLRKMIQWDDISHLAESYIAMVAGIPLISASVLQTQDRHMAGEFMIDQLKRIRYEQYTVRYTPTFASRLFGNNFEMSALSGSRLISDRFGIVLTGTKTIGQVLGIVSDAVHTAQTTDSNSRILTPLTQLRDKLRTFVGETEACPVCLEEYEMESGASLINPCWHIVCDKCLRGMMAAQHTRCPMCRVKIEGHTTALMESTCPTATGAGESVHDDKIETRLLLDSSRSLVDNMNAILRPTAGLEKACIDALRCIRADVGDRTYKIVMIVPDEHFFTKFAIDVREEMDVSQIQIIEFKTCGTKRKHVTGKMVAGRIETFASDQGPPMKILFTTEGKTDSLTGLDFPRVDCIISLGDGNSLQRLGRLTRLPRMLDEASASKTVRYICLEPVS